MSGRIADRLLLSGFDAAGRFSGRLIGVLATLASDDVPGVPLRPMVLWSAGSVYSVPVLRLAQQINERRQIPAEPPAGEPSLDFLQHPAIAVRITERSI